MIYIVSNTSHFQLLGELRKLDPLSSTFICAGAMLLMTCDFVPAVFHLWTFTVISVKVNSVVNICLI